jgi:predicted ArsR family transcriptional regulator
MVEQIIKTGVDELLELLKNTSKVALADVAKSLNVSMDVIQAWVDFLVEEGIVGIEYKFTTPYIYMNKAIATKPLAAQGIVDKDQGMTIHYFKSQFWDRAIKNNIPRSKIEELWKNHLLQALENKKKYFFFEAQNRKLLNIEYLWEEYVHRILVK